jgi:hypothetical protein
MNTLTAGALKIGGVAAIERAMIDKEPIFISVRGQKKFAVVDIDKFNTLCDLEMDSAIRESEMDYKNGNYSIIKDIDDYERKLSQELDL